MNLPDDDVLPVVAVALAEVGRVVLGEVPGPHLHSTTVVGSAATIDLSGRTAATTVLFAAVLESSAVRCQKGDVYSEESVPSFESTRDHT